MDEYVKRITRLTHSRFNIVQTAKMPHEAGKGG